ncbi:MAG: hypothetical protein JXB03_10975, partial [Spirochaetales bacterium]|nr:hypothetical protein [Spirochaetales bacterium]
MGKRPPERYEPGELQRTRNNLGEVSKEEARNLAKKLGGEVGVEKISPEIEKSYHRLKAINRRKGEDPLDITPREHSPGQPVFASLSPLEPSFEKIKTPRLGYLERMRINFLLADPNFRIKSRTNAYLALLSFAVPVKDTLASSFITEFDSRFYTSIENLVLSVRGLWAINKNENIRNIRHPAYLRILEILRTWDLEVINSELARLQKNTRGLSVTEAKRLTRAVYRPLIVLGNLDLHRHILKAVKHLADLNFLGLPKNSPEIGRIKRLYATAKQELYQVFADIRKQLYPLLLRLSGSHYYEFEEFFSYAQTSIFSFLSITDQDVLSPFDDALLAEQLQMQDEELQKEEETSDEAYDNEQEAAVKPVGVEKGLAFLDALFPEAGFLALDTFPDLYAYFQPILSFPGGLDLISPRNPVHQVMVIAAIIEELFYGFRPVKFGELILDNGHYESIQPRMDDIISQWHRFSDEVLHQNYLPTLSDYCRHIERNPDIRYGEYGTRMEAFLQFFVRKYVFPHLHMFTLKSAKTPFPEKLYRVYEETAKTKRLLEDILNSDLINAIPPSIKNSNAPFVFEIENHVSKQLRKYLKRRGQEPNNRNLINCTLLTVTVLDFLLNDFDNFLYQSEAFTHYRHEEAREDIPLYSVPPKDTERILLESQIDLTPPEAFLVDDSLKRDSREHQARKILKSHISALINDGTPLSILAVYHLSQTAKSEPDVYRIMESTIREYMDILLPDGDGTYLLILPETTEDEAESLYQRLCERLKEGDEHAYTWGCVTSCMKSWGPEKFLKTARQGL